MMETIQKSLGQNGSFMYCFSHTYKQCLIAETAKFKSGLQCITDYPCFCSCSLLADLICKYN
uniref:Uncharacterized protein n=1 Tax=Anguilla anguilla TaxID=7936 RepID=A0A0E9WY16_ANGAN